MNKNIKKTVYNILETNELARTDDWYLIQQTLMKMLPCESGTAFGRVLEGMKYKGISFEAITRARRKFLETRPELKRKSSVKTRQKEEHVYNEEYGHHVPKID